MSHSLIAPLLGQPVDLEERRGSEPRHRPTRALKAADPSLDQDARSLPESRRHRVGFKPHLAGSASGAPHVFPDYLFRINADNTIVDVLRGAPRPLALPSYVLDEKSQHHADSGFGEKFWDAVHRVRGTGAPRRLEQRSLKQGDDSLF